MSNYCDIHTCNNCIECALIKVESAVVRSADRIIHSMEEIEAKRSILGKFKKFLEKRRMDKMFAEKKNLRDLVERNYCYDIPTHSWRLKPDCLSLSDKQIETLNEGDCATFYFERKLND